MAKISDDLGREPQPCTRPGGAALPPDSPAIRGLRPRTPAAFEQIHIEANKSGTNRFFMKMILTTIILAISVVKQELFPTLSGSKTLR